MESCRFFCFLFLGLILCTVVLSAVHHDTSLARQSRAASEEEAEEAEATSETNTTNEAESEQEEVSPPEVDMFQEAPTVRITLACLYTLIILLVVGGNGLVAYLIYKEEHLFSNANHYFFLSLVAARAAVGLFVIPARVTGLFDEIYIGKFLCDLCHFFDNSSNLVSVLSIVVVAVLKYRNVIQNKRYPNKRQSSYLMLAVWVVGMIYAMPMPFIVDLYPVNVNGVNYYICATEPSPQIKVEIARTYIILDLVLFFILPTIVIVFCITSVLRKLYQQTDVSDSTRKASAMLIALVVCFVVCIGCPVFLELYNAWLKPANTRIENYHIIEAAVYMTSYSNAWINIVIFFIFRADLRAAFMICIMKRKRDIYKTEEVLDF